MMILRAIVASWLVSFPLTPFEGRAVEGLGPGDFRARPVQGTVLLTNTYYFVPNGQGGTTRFVTPGKPGFFTWAQLLPTSVPGRRPGQNVLVVEPARTGFVCAGLPSAAGAASAVLQDCVNRTPDGTALDLPPGRYVLDRQVRVERPIVVRTAGVRADDAACGETAAPVCAEFAADAGFADPFGLLISTAPNDHLTLDHLVLDGNKQLRGGSGSARRCASEQSENQYGFNADLNNCKECRVTNSTFKNALCGTGLRVWNVSVVNSRFTGNGVHTGKMFADGLTVGRCDASYVVNNQLSDNTDVDLIFGSGIGCRGQDNVITHTPDRSQGSFVGLMLFTWYTAGHYFDSDFSFNRMDCADQCGIGLYLGADQAFGPYATFIEGGSVHDNTIHGAHQGVAVDAARNVVFYNNHVAGTSATSPTFCGTLPTTAYSMSPETQLDRSMDPIPDPWLVRQWDYCTPNWTSVFPPMLTLAADFNGDGATDTLDAFPSDQVASHTWNVSLGTRSWLTGWGVGNRYVVADLDGNGRKDVVLYLNSGRRWYVALAQDGFFVPIVDALVSVELPASSCSVPVAGNRDDVVIESNAGSTCVAFDTTSRHLVTRACDLRCEPLDPNSPPSTTSHLLYGDFNGDRIRDALSISATNAGWSVTTGRREWMRGWIAGDYNLVGDFDGDGRDDVLVVRNGATPTWDLAQSGGAWFDQRPGTLTGVRVTDGVCVGNTDGDPADEVILRRAEGNLCADFNPLSGTFSLRSCTAQCPQ